MPASVRCTRTPTHGRRRRSSTWPAPESSRATAPSPSMQPRSGTPRRAPCRSGERVVEETVAHMTKEPATLSPLAGKPAPKSILVDLARLEQAYYERKPDTDDPSQLVIFGTSGHRGSGR